MTLLEQRCSGPDAQDIEALFREAKRRRRKRQLWVATTLIAAFALTLSALWAVGGFSGHTSPGPGGLSGGSAALGGPLPDQSTTAAPAIVGDGPTSIDFIDAEHGWIATGCSSYCYNTAPVIVRTDDGGRTWHQIRGPAVGSAHVSGATWYQYGGVVDVRFTDRMHGWYLQAGGLWSTVNGGATWQLGRLGGIVTTFTSSGTAIWALVDSCPGGALLACPPFHVYYRSASALAWRRSPTTLVVGNGFDSGSSLVASGSLAYVSTRGRLYQATPDGVLRVVDASCRPIGALAEAGLVGLCNMGGGGDASTVWFSTSADHGQHWNRFAAGPPSPVWSGPTATNGSGALFYITGGTGLWRLDAATRRWTLVLHTPPGSTDEFGPLYFVNANFGLVGETGSSGTHLLVTHDAGLTWSAVRSV